MITPEIRATIRRLVLREGWKIETTARRFGVHHSVVRRALRELEQPERRPAVPSEFDPFKEYLVQRLTEHPELTAVRLSLELQLRGFTGGIAQLRRYVAQVRAPRARKAYLRIETEPGEQAQVDWGSFGHWRVGNTQRPLSAFAMVMRWSRAPVSRLRPRPAHGRLDAAWHKETGRALAGRCFKTLRSRREALRGVLEITEHDEADSTRSSTRLRAAGPSQSGGKTMVS